MISQRAAWVLVALMMACYVAGYAYSAPHTDTADEIMRAFEIRHGLAYPIEGPFLGNALHLGPAWFYLVAIPLWFSETWLAVVLFIGFVASLKFALAYWCGRRLIDSDFGLAWALAMFVPGWNSIEQLTALNPNAVAAALLLVLAIFLQGMRVRATTGLFFVLGLAFALAIHVHPTTLPAGVLVVVLMAIHRRRGGSLVRAIAASAAGFVLPFLPYVASQLVNGFPDWKSASSYATDQISLSNIVNAPSVILNYLMEGPALIGRYILGWSQDASHALGIALVALSLTSLATLIRAPALSPARRLFIPFSGALILVAAWIACARPATPVQFVWILCPLVAALVALGLWSLSRFRAIRPLVIVIAVSALAFNCVAIRAVAFVVRDGEWRLPMRVLDIKGGLPPTEASGTWFPALAHTELGRLLCKTPGTIDLHGHLAEIVDKDLGLDTLLECHDRSRLSLAGDHGQARYAGMTRAFWRALDWKAPCVVGSLGITRNVVPLSRHEGLAVADGSTYLPRRHGTASPKEVLLTGKVPPGHAVLVTNVLGPYETFHIASAQMDGKSTVPLIGNDLSQLYMSPRSSADAVPFRFVVLTSNPDAVDLISIAAPAAVDGTCGAT